MPNPRPLLAALAAAIIVAAGCSGADDGSADAEPSVPAASATDATDTSEGIRLVSAADGAAIAADPPSDLVILDVRTPEEFAEGHLDGATMIDFYAADFADQLAELDPDVPYLLYCRSGNRSGQTAAMMEALGFSDVADIDGGVLSWTDAGLELVGS